MAPTAVSAPGLPPIVDYAQGYTDLMAGITHRKVGAVLLPVWTAGVERSPERRTFSISHNKNRSIVYNGDYLHVSEWFALLTFPPSTACRTYPAQPEFRGSFLLAAGPRQDWARKRGGVLVSMAIRAK